MVRTRSSMRSETDHVQEETPAHAQDVSPSTSHSDDLAGRHRPQKNKTAGQKTPPLKEQESDSEREEDEEAMRGDGEQSGKGVGSLDFGDLPWLSDVEIAAMREEMEAGANVREEYDHDDEELLERELRSKLATLQERKSKAKQAVRRVGPVNVAVLGQASIGSSEASQAARAFLEARRGRHQRAAARVPAGGWGATGVPRVGGNLAVRKAAVAKRQR